MTLQGVSAVILAGAFASSTARTRYDLFAEGRELVYEPDPLELTHRSNPS